MNLMDIFLSIFIGTLLFAFVVKTIVKVYMDIREELNKK